MIKYLARIRELREGFDAFILQQIPRTRQSEEVDQLAKLNSSSTLLKGRSITLLIPDRPEVEEMEDEVLANNAEPSWKDELESYLKSGDFTPR